MKNPTTSDLVCACVGDVSLATRQLQTYKAQTLFAKALLVIRHTKLSHHEYDGYPIITPTCHIPTVRDTTGWQPVISRTFGIRRAANLSYPEHSGYDGLPTCHIPNSRDTTGWSYYGEQVISTIIGILHVHVQTYRSWLFVFLCLATNLRHSITCDVFSSCCCSQTYRQPERQLCKGELNECYMIPIVQRCIEKLS